MPLNSFLINDILANDSTAATATPSIDAPLEIETQMEPPSPTGTITLSDESDDDEIIWLSQDGNDVCMRRQPQQQEVFSAGIIIKIFNIIK